MGGYAYIHYAEPRYTKDIDLWVLPSPENALRLREALVRFGGWVEGMTLDHFTTERTMFQIGLPPCRVDFLTSIAGRTVMQQIPAYGPNTMEPLRQNFATNHSNIQKLIVEIALTACED